jgi:hypothetical protein
LFVTPQGAPRAHLFFALDLAFDLASDLAFDLAFDLLAP